MDDKDMVDIHKNWGLTVQYYENRHSMSFPFEIENGSWMGEGDGRGGQAYRAGCPLLIKVRNETTERQKMPFIKHGWAWFCVQYSELS